MHQGAIAACLTGLQKRLLGVGAFLGTLMTSYVFL
jgi:hypothetical protein